LGSIIINLSSDGENLNNILKINQFIQTDFQDAVCPATNKCGIFVKSQITISAFTSFQIAIGISNFEELNNGFSKTSLSQTVLLSLFGVSIPTTPRPGIGA
jgi:hypothetical protein